MEVGSMILKLQKGYYSFYRVGGLVSMAIIVAATSIATRSTERIGLSPKDWNHYLVMLPDILWELVCLQLVLPRQLRHPWQLHMWPTVVLAGNAGMKDKDLGLYGWLSCYWCIALSFGINPIEIIKFAQVANGLLLPVIAYFLLWIVNKASVLGNIGIPFGITFWRF